MFKRACRAAGAGDGWTPRELRTSFVSLMSHHGVSTEEIARLVGQPSARTTEVVYRRKRDLVWCGPQGQPIDPHDDWEEWKALLAEAGVAKDARLHDARHTAGTLLGEQHVDIHVIQRILGTRRSPRPVSTPSRPTR